MRPGPTERTNRELDEQLEQKAKRVPSRLELEVELRETALDLLIAAQSFADRLFRDGRPRPFGDDYRYDSADRAPTCFILAARAFAAFDLLGYDAASVYKTARELRPWVGEWTPHGCAR